MLSLENLSINKSGKKLFNLSLTILPGSLTYITGCNGSGKSSLIKLMAGLINPSAGKISLSGMPLQQLKKPYCCYIGHELGIYYDFTVYRNIAFWAKVYGSELAIESAISFLKLEDILEEKCKTLSAGNKKRVTMARLMLSPAPLWLLDEIDSNLDEKNQNLLSGLINCKVASGGIVAIATHNYQNAVNHISHIKL